MLPRLLAAALLVACQQTEKPQDEAPEMPQPAPRAAHATVVCEGRIYLLGGSSADTWATARVESWAPGEKRWRTHADLPIACAFPAAVSVNGKIYVVGGMAKDREYLDDFHEFDPATETWERLSPLPLPRNRHAAALHDESLWVIGGMVQGEKDEPVNTDDVCYYSFRRGAWVAAEPLPTPRHAVTAFDQDHRLCIAGGYGGGPTEHSQLAEVLAWIDAWEFHQGLLNRRGFHAAATHEERTFLFGGRCECIDEVIASSASVSKAVPADPANRSRFGAVVLGDVIYLTGGETPGGLASDPVVRRFDPVREAWIDAAD